jgi:RNA-directed DNA polymerase
VQFDATVAALEDKIVQAAVVAILTPIYEAEFLGFSHGFRPGRNQHDALDALAYGINARKINWVLDADIARFFDTLSREWLIRFIEHRVGDRRIIRLIQKWMRAGVLEDGQLIETTEGTPQGSVVSPLLANVYLHYVYDLWAEQWRSRHATGDMIIVRYADDQIVGFQHRSDAERFLNDLKQRLAAFALSLHPEKTRLIEFGRYAAERRAERGLGKPETFDFLGLTHYCSTGKDGSGFQLGRKTQRKRMRAKLREIKETLRLRRHVPIDEQGQYLGAVIRGHYAYFAVPTNGRLLSAFRYNISIMWFQSLRRRSQRHLPTVTARAASMAGPAVPRHTLKVRTECVSSARSGLCGGRGVIFVPTAINGSNSEVPISARRDLAGGRGVSLVPTGT